MDSNLSFRPPGDQILIRRTKPTHMPHLLSTLAFAISFDVFLFDGKYTDAVNLFRVPQRDRCATNQLPYSLGDRSIERDLLPRCERRGMPVMTYSPLGGPGASVLRNPTLARIAQAHGCSAAAIALAWVIRSASVIAIPESGSVAHVKENAVALSLTLIPQDLQMLDAAHPPPNR
jgi:diketogulonate reductase-like aldo/keto reductase